MKKRGQTILELIIALAIIVVGISAAVVVFFGGQSLQVDTQLGNEASYLARELLEQARFQARQGFSVLASSSSTQGIYTKETIIQGIDANTKKVIARISWQTDPARPQKVEVVSILTDWRNVAPPGNWCSPRILGSVDLGPGISATNLDVVNKIIYMSAEALSPSEPDFFVVDASNSQSPVVKASLNTGPSLNAVSVSGNYAYLANRDTSAQLQIVDISNINSPTLIASLRLPGVSGSGAVGNTVFFSDSKVYLGTKKATGPEFHIVDVSTPGSPVALGSKKLDADIGAIYVKGNYAYVANSSGGKLKILDISDPSNITLVGGFNAPGDENGKSIYLAGSELYLGRTTGKTPTHNDEFYILDATNPASVQNLRSTGLGADVNGIRVRGNFALLATSDPDKEFQVWNLSNFNLTLCSALNFPQEATGIDYEDNLVYVSVRSNDALRIIAPQ